MERVTEGNKRKFLLKLQDTDDLKIKRTKDRTKNPNQIISKTVHSGTFRKTQKHGCHRSGTVREKNSSMSVKVREFYFESGKIEIITPLI